MGPALDTRIADRDVPRRLERVLLNFPWELNRLLALDLPIEEIAVSDFTWLLALRIGERTAGGSS